MCGIFGSFSNTPVPEELIGHGLSALNHRGPDANGVYFSPDSRLCLGHTRLSVLDLTPGANQPMHSSDQRYIIVYNGEIYNFREISNELKKKAQYEFRTASDTEVILAAWQYWGPACLDKFNGMFAFAIWDQYERKLWLCRDRLGIKPLYICRDSTRLIFASELKAIIPLLREPVICMKAVAAFLHLGFIPEPLCIYRNVEKFPAGHYATLDENGQWECRSWWYSGEQLSEPRHSTEVVAERELFELLESSIGYRMIADVPFGTFLSGGTDSSIVTALACRLSPHPLKTFSIGFEDAKFDESKYAAGVAGHLKTDHTAFMLYEKDALPMMEEIIPTYDEPFGDTSSIPTMLISRLARKDVKVILTGDGGDELFHGYGAYRWAKRLAFPGLRPLRGAVKAALLMRGSSRYVRAAGFFTSEAHSSPRDHIFSQEQHYFSNSELTQLLLPEAGVYTYKDPINLPPAMSAAAKQAFFDLNVYLRDDLLVKVDRASMKYGLECRLPFLDYRLVSWALSLPDRFKTKGGESKWILKKLLEKHLPYEMIYRPKWGFSVPLAAWLMGDMRYLVEENLSPKALEATGMLRPAAVDDLLRSFFGGKIFLYNRVWALVLLQKWLKSNAWSVE